MLFMIHHPELLGEALINRDGILKRAENAMETVPRSLADALAPMSKGGARDYYSNGDYWWPDPDTPDGLPYVRRDGLSNPENFNTHRRILRGTRDAISALSSAYLLTGSRPYVKKAEDILRHFFLNEATGMKPSLQYAQAIPGICSGRCIGIIDGLQLVEIPVAVDRIASVMDPGILEGLKQWFTDYLDWLITHPFGAEERRVGNNHTVSYIFQLAVISRWLGRESVTEDCIRAFKEELLPNQMDGKGAFPREIARTRPYNYSIFNINLFCLLALVLSTAENDVWDFALPDGRSVKKGVDFLYPYIEKKPRWEADGYHADVQGFNVLPMREPFLLYAALAYGERKYLDTWQALPDEMEMMEEVKRNHPFHSILLWIEHPAMLSDDSKINEEEKKACGTSE